MQWSPQQDAALLAVDRWLKDGDSQLFRMFGYAGTGKTTLAQHFASNVEGMVLFGAYTGKAASVLHRKGCEGATTIHSLIYRTKEKGRARLKELEVQLATLMQELVQMQHSSPETHPRVKDIRKMIEREREEQSRPAFSLNTESEVRDAQLVIIDECSMVDDQMGEDLLSFGTKILVLGDPAQLPPIGGAGFFTEGVKPDVMLTEIHRQAADNPIISMATRVRNEQSLPLGTYGNCSVVRGSDINEHDALSANQILVGRNKTRHASNHRLRELNGITEILPVPGDKLVCLRNNRDKGLLNGTIWFCESMSELSEDRLFMVVRPEDEGPVVETEVHSHYFLGKDEKLTWWERKEAEEFDYGGALTVHKSQGSQWDKILLFDESWCFRKDRYRWLYTAITRAAEEVKIVQT